MDIFVYKDELSPSQFNSAMTAIAESVNKINAAYTYASSVYGYEGRMIFAGQIDELRLCLSEAVRLSEQLTQYASLLDTAPAELIDKDAEFNNVLSNAWQRFLFGISSVLGLFSTGSVSGKTGSQFDIDKTIQKNAIKAENDIVDDYRNNYGSGATKKGSKNNNYSTKTTKTVSILPGSNYTVTRYRDYKDLSYMESSGDGFYEASTGVGLHGEHFEIESNDGTAISIDTNALDINLNGSFDPAKGNAYINAGAEYNLVKATVIDYESSYNKVSLSFQAGVGGHVNIGFHDGKFTADVSAARWIGASIKLEFNYLESWKHIRSMFS